MFDPKCALFNIGASPITLGSLLEFIIILALTLIIGKIIKGQVRRFDKSVSNSGIYTLSRLAYYIVLILGSITAFNAVGIDLSTIAVIAGALSVGIGFGMQAIFNNFVCGVILLFEKNIRVGDTVELDSGHKGTIKEIYVRTTLIVGESGQILIIPNSDLVSRCIINWSSTRS